MEFVTCIHGSLLETETILFQVPIFLQSAAYKLVQWVVRGNVSVPSGIRPLGLQLHIQLLFAAALVGNPRKNESSNEGYRIRQEDRKLITISRPLTVIWPIDLPILPEFSQRTLVLIHFFLAAWPVVGLPFPDHLALIFMSIPDE
ncbi:hypothetical protein Tco_0032322 [Tanacetum coccineum]